jgi:hypothetical protein
MEEVSEDLSSCRDVLMTAIYTDSPHLPREVDSNAIDGKFINCTQSELMRRQMVSHQSSLSNADDLIFGQPLRSLNTGDEAICKTRHLPCGIEKMLKGKGNPQNASKTSLRLCGNEAEHRRRTRKRRTPALADVAGLTRPVLAHPRRHDIRRSEEG